MKILIDKKFKEQLRDKLGYGEDIFISLCEDYTGKNVELVEIRVCLKGIWYNKHIKTLKTTTHDIKYTMNIPKDYKLFGGLKMDNCSYFEDRK